MEITILKLAVIAGFMLAFVAVVVGITSYSKYKIRLQNEQERSRNQLGSATTAPALESA